MIQIIKYLVILAIIVNRWHLIVYFIKLVYFLRSSSDSFMINICITNLYEDYFFERPRIDNDDKNNCNYNFSSSFELKSKYPLRLKMFNKIFTCFMHSGCE